MPDVICPKCGVENNFDIDNDSIVCEECGAMLNISEKDGMFIAEQF